MSFDSKIFEKLMSGGSAITAAIALGIAANFLFTNISDKPSIKHDDNLKQVLLKVQRDQDSYDKLIKLEKQVNLLSNNIESMKILITTIRQIYILKISVRCIQRMINEFQKLKKLLSMILRKQ